MGLKTKVALVAAATVVVISPTVRGAVLSAASDVSAPVVAAVGDEISFLRGPDGDDPARPSIASPTPDTDVSAAPVAGPTKTAAPEPEQTTQAAVPGALGSGRGADHYAFTVRGTDGKPGRWSSCEPIRIVVNPANAPAGAVDDLHLAVQQVKAASGLPLTVVGQTTAESVPNWGSKKRSGYDGWAPVLVSWGRPGGALNPGASATTEPTWAANRAGQTVFVSGQLRINVDHDHFYSPGFGGQASRVALYMHELGHVVGLEHVDDADQLMYPSMGMTPDFGAGDLNGLKKAGAAGCLDVPNAPWQ